MPPVLIIVTGLPAAGKTTLSQRLARDLVLPLLSRDSLKEILFDTLGWGDHARSQLLGAASFKLLYYVLERMLQTGQPCIIESNFSPQLASPTLSALLERSSYHAIQVVCTAPLELLEARYLQRHTPDVRHPGHMDSLDFQQLGADAGPLHLPGQIITLDTADFATLDYSALLTRLREALS